MNPLSSDLMNRQGDAYVGLYSWRPVQYRSENGTLLKPGTPANGDLIRDIVANGVQNVWICEARPNNQNDFIAFLQRLVPPLQTAALKTSESAWSHQE